jgi:hypothetical protein
LGFVKEMHEFNSKGSSDWPCPKEQALDGR